jgi:hypothetical protein
VQLKDNYINFFIFENISVFLPKEKKQQITVKDRGDFSDVIDLYIRVFVNKQQHQNMINAH